MRLWYKKKAEEYQAAYLAALQAEQYEEAERLLKEYENYIIMIERCR